MSNSKKGGGWANGRVREGECLKGRAEGEAGWVAERRGETSEQP